jgi:hypothetical protein
MDKRLRLRNEGLTLLLGAKLRRILTTAAGHQAELRVWMSQKACNVIKA